MCRYPECNKAEHGHGYCGSHAAQIRRGKKTGPLRKYREKAKPTQFVNGKRMCPRCKETKGPEEYNRNKGRSDGCSAYCRSCCRWVQIEWKYGLTQEDYEAIWDYQLRGCAICGTEDPGHKHGFTVDHDHECCDGNKTCGRCVRGIICSACNQRVDTSGEIRDTAYRERHNRRTVPLKELARMSTVLG